MGCDEVRDQFRKDASLKVTQPLLAYVLALSRKDHPSRALSIIFWEKEVTRVLSPAEG
jgi:hypothetical protein